jgi:homoserine kinase
MRARAPASAANLGPGFDVLAVALDLYVEVEVEPAPRLVVRSEGEGADLDEDDMHLAARVAIDVVGHDRLAVTVRSDIPVGRGLGSSAALAVAAAAAAGSKDPLGVAARIDGHPENAAASAVGACRCSWPGWPTGPS